MRACMLAGRPPGRGAAGWCHHEGRKHAMKQKSGARRAWRAVSQSASTMALHSCGHSRARHGQRRSAAALAPWAAETGAWHTQEQDPQACGSVQAAPQGSAAPLYLAVQAAQVVGQGDVHAVVKQHQLRPRLLPAQQLQQAGRRVGARAHENVACSRRERGVRGAMHGKLSAGRAYKTPVVQCRQAGRQASEQASSPATCLGAGPRV